MLAELLTPTHWTRDVIRMTSLLVTGDVEGKLQRLQWRSGQSPWQPSRFCAAILNTVRYHYSPTQNNRMLSLAWQMLIINQTMNWQYMGCILWTLWKKTGVMIRSHCTFLVNFSGVEGFPSRGCWGRMGSQKCMCFSGVRLMELGMLP